MQAFCVVWLLEAEREQIDLPDLLTSEASSSVVYQENLSMSGPAQPGPAHADAFEGLISLRLCVRFPYALHRGIGPFKLP